MPDYAKARWHLLMLGPRAPIAKEKQQHLHWRRRLHNSATLSCSHKHIAQKHAHREHTILPHHILRHNFFELLNPAHSSHDKERTPYFHAIKKSIPRTLHLALHTLSLSYAPGFAPQCQWFALSAYMPMHQMAIAYVREYPQP